MRKRADTAKAQSRCRRERQAGPPRCRHQSLILETPVVFALPGKRAEGSDDGVIVVHLATWPHEPLHSCRRGVTFGGGITHCSVPSLCVLVALALSQSLWGRCCTTGGMASGTPTPPPWQMLYPGIIHTACTVRLSIVCLYYHQGYNTCITYSYLITIISVKWHLNPLQNVSQVSCSALDPVSPSMCSRKVSCTRSCIDSMPILFTLFLCFSWKGDHQRRAGGHAGKWKPSHLHIWRESLPLRFHLVVEEGKRVQGGVVLHAAGVGGYLYLVCVCVCVFLSDHFRFPDHTSGCEWDRVTSPGHHAPGVEHQRASHHVHGYGHACRKPGNRSCPFLFCQSWAQYVCMQTK